MNSNSLQHDLETALAEMPIMDVHTHISGGGKLAARGLHDVLLYHMVISDLYGAGCPSGARLTEFPNWPDQAEAHARIEEALPYLPHIRNTAMAWGLRLILRDLYDWNEPLTAGNWRRLDELIRERAGDQAWAGSILDRVHIQRTCAELARRGPGDERLQHSMEWGFFTRTQWGEYDTALYELERCWGQTPGGTIPIGTGVRPAPERTIGTLDDVHAAMDHYLSVIPFADIISMATHISTDNDYKPVSEAEMAAALARRGEAGLAERSIYASYIFESFLTRLEPHGREIVFQFSLGAEPLPFETGARLNQATLAQLAEIIARHPGIRFQVLLASRHANQTLCTFARELPNFSLAGYWWHSFFPSAISQFIDERLDMVPANKQVAFFSDAYCVEWAYGKWLMVRKLLAHALAARIDRGQYTVADALSIARTILYETPQTLMGMAPRAQ
jgi:glucuronate isomerase